MAGHVRRQPGSCCSSNGGDSNCCRVLGQAQAALARAPESPLQVEGPPCRPLPMQSMVLGSTSPLS